MHLMYKQVMELSPFRYHGSKMTSVIALTGATSQAHLPANPVPSFALADRKSVV